MKLGEWTRRVSFTIVPLDDYKVVLGQEFMQTGEGSSHSACRLFGYHVRTNSMSGAYSEGEQGMNMSSLRLVDNQHPCLDISGRGEEMVETKNSDDPEVLADLEWHQQDRRYLG
jgi:hypothetical protein